MFKAVVDEVIKRAERRRGAEDLEPRMDAADVVERLLSGPNLHDAALLKYLRSRSHLEVMALLTLMYIGRDHDPDDGEVDLEGYWDHHVETFETKELAINQMLEKSPLDDYLRDGLRFVDPSAVLACGRKYDLE